MTVRARIAAYIEDISGETRIDHSINLFETGLLTSLDVLDLVDFLEQSFKLEISGNDVDMSSFGTIDGLVSLITRLQSTHGHTIQVQDVCAR